ncbi:STAS domain-containing protein [Bacillus sp. B1-b2]|uniref:STAS domain-containing protein n=1 Tax=Bacillus sp. B1-b2 TaxID=2653201 RepID=UPI0012628C0D|nr:STAS domain-containing protein [Bacillus sp. B1-b2]KAB7667622.1 STAS domain-containing protein [Bacillus sp. B1-b2]
MKDELAYIGNKIIKNKSILGANINQLLIEFLSKDFPYQSLPFDEKGTLEWNAKLFSILGEALKDNKNATEVQHWSEKTGKAFVDHLVPLQSALRSLSIYRNIIWDVFTEELEQKSFAPITMLDVGKIIDPILDEISAIIGHIYEQSNTQKMKMAYSALEELSVPVVPIAKETAIIPLIGEIDTRRSQLILEVALQESANLKIEYLILDISGVPIVDTMVADNLFKVVHALDLIGVKSIISGIRPEIAQTIISLGIDFSQVTTCANLHTALASIGLKRVIE